MMYVPILKAKEGEYAALGELDLSVRHRIIPLFEVPEVPYDYVSDRPVRTLRAHLQSVTRKLQQNWGGDFPAYLDVSALNADPDRERFNPLGSVLNDSRVAGLQVIPVVARTDSSESLQATAAHHSQAGLGACLRLKVDDFDEEIDLEESTSDLTRAINVPVSELDLLIDLAELQGDIQRSVLLARAMLAAVPNPSSWRRIILAGSSFPEDLRDVDAATVRVLPRKEWELWSTLQRRPERLPRRNLIFGDYGITHPTLKEVDPRTMTMSASIRYTASGEWLIVKGRNVRQYGFDQYFSLCETLVQHPLYSGPEYSWGDRYISHTAARKSGPGNATTWRKVGTNHHITLTAIELSTTHDP